MARPLRIEYPGAYYHGMNRGLNRQRIFADDKDRHNFLDLIGEIHRLWKVEIFAYCLMGNHFRALPLLYQTTEQRKVLSVLFEIRSLGSL